MFLVEVCNKAIIITIVYIILHVIEMYIIPKYSMEHIAIFITVPVSVIAGLYFYQMIYG